MTKTIDYGPLTNLIGAWAGDRGSDVSPEPDGSAEHSPYYETILFEPAEDTENAEEQELVALRYHQIVRRKSNDLVFHNQVGYWMWDADAGVVMQSLAIPRGVCLLAGGRWRPVDGTRVEFHVSARLGDAEWGIVQSPFMAENASTVAFEHTLAVDKNRLVYEETTSLVIYGEDFAHTDHNELTRQ